MQPGAREPGGSHTALSADEPPPETASWSARLHWIVRSIPTRHPDLAFAASLLAQSIERPGLTERQARYAIRMFDRLAAEWLERSGSHGASADLSCLIPAGRA